MEATRQPDTAQPKRRKQAQDAEGRAWRTTWRPLAEAGIAALIQQPGEEHQTLESILRAEYLRLDASSSGSAGRDLYCMLLRGALVRDLISRALLCAAAGCLFNRCKRRH